MSDDTIPDLKSVNHIRGAVKRLKEDPRFCGYEFEYVIANMVNPRIKTTLSSDGLITFTIPLQFKSYPGGAILKLLQTSLAKVLKEDFGSRYRVPWQVRTFVFGNRNDEGIKFELDLFKINNGIIEVDDEKKNRSLEKCLKIVTKALPNMKDKMNGIEFRLRKHMNLEVHPIANVSPHANVVFVDEAILGKEVPDRVKGFIIYHEIGVLRTWDRKTDVFRDKRIDSYVRSWRRYYDVLNYMDEVGWRFEYGNRNAEYYGHSRNPGADPGTDEAKDSQLYQEMHIQGRISDNGGTDEGVR